MIGTTFTSVWPPASSSVFRLLALPLSYATEDARALPVLSVQVWAKFCMVTGMGVIFAVGSDNGALTPGTTSHPAG
ncbi:hypothetical protein [Streptomyces rubiginosohelvolus]